MTKSCPPISGPSQSQEHTGGINHQQQSAQERSHNQSAVSQKSNSLSANRQQDVQSPNLMTNQMPNLSNQQQQA